MTPPRGLFFPRPALHETLRTPRSPVPAQPVFLRGPPIGGKSPIISPDPDSKPAISSPLLFTLIPVGIHGDRRTRDKPITHPSRKNKPEVPPGQKTDLEDKFV